MKPEFTDEELKIARMALRIVSKRMEKDPQETGSRWLENPELLVGRVALLQGDGFKEMDHLRSLVNKLETWEQETKR